MSRSSPWPERALTGLLAGLLLVACQQDRLIGEERASTLGGGGNGGDGGTIDMTSSVSTVSPTGGGAGPIGCAGASPDARAAIAVLGSQLNSPTPDSLYFAFGDPAPTCADPIPLVPCGGFWGMRIGVPPALQHPGTIALSESDPNNFQVEMGPGGPDCSGGGGSILEGTIEIVCIAEAGAIFRIAGTPPFTLAGVDPNGEYVASRCP